MSDKADKHDKLFDRVEAAIEFGGGMEFTHAELVAWHGYLLTAHVQVQATLDMARTIGASLREVGLQIHVRADGNVDGIMPLARGGAQGTVN